MDCTLHDSVSKLSFRAYGITKHHFLSQLCHLAHLGKASPTTEKQFSSYLEFKFTNNLPRIPKSLH